MLPEILLVLVTAFCDVGIMYNGGLTTPGMAACPAEDPIGTEYCFPMSDMCWTCADRGRMVNRLPEFTHIDIWTCSCDDATQWGRQFLLLERRLK